MKVTVIKGPHFENTKRQAQKYIMQLVMKNTLKKEA